MFLEALEAVANAVAITDRHGTIEWVNRAFTRLSGYSHDEAVGRTPRLLKSGVHPPAFYEQLWSTILDGQVWRGEIVERHKDGHHYTVSQTITPVLDGHGVITHFVAVHEDISPLLESQQRLQAVFDHALDAILVSGPDGAYVAANPAASTLTGYSHDELLTMGLPDLVAPGRHPDAGPGRCDAFVANGEESGPLAMLHKSGRVIETEYRTAANILPGLHLAVHRDVTGHNASVRALQASEARFRKLAEAASDIVAIVHVNDALKLSVDYINPAAERILGNPVDGRRPDLFDLMEACHPNDAETLQRLLVNRQPGGARATVRLKNTNDDWVALEVVATVTDDAGEYRTVQIIARDVTDRQRIHAALQAALEDEREAAQAVEVLNETRRRLLQNISHELRTPLTVILGFADLLSRPNHGIGVEQHRNYHQRIVDNARRLEKILDDLVDLDPTNDTLPLDLTTVELSELLLTTDLGVLGARTVSLDLEPIEIAVDAPKVGRILDSLISNIARHTPPDCNVVLRLRPTVEGAQLTVQDDGPGIPPELYNNLFEPFRQGERAGNAAQPGAGLGLPLVQIFTEAHGGRVWVDATHSAGTTVHVLLPYRSSLTGGTTTQQLTLCQQTECCEVPTGPSESAGVSGPAPTPDNGVRAHQAPAHVLAALS